MQVTYKTLKQNTQKYNLILEYLITFEIFCVVTCLMNVLVLYSESSDIRTIL